MSPVGKTLVRSATGIAVAAGLAYLVDPDSGARRRQWLRDQCTGAARRVGDGARVARFDITDRLNRASARVKATLGRGERSSESRSNGSTNGESPNNESLARRVRVALWRAVPHPGAIKVAAHDGHVILYGDVVAAEHPHVMQLARAIEGVREVSDHLKENTRGLENVRGFVRVKQATLSIKQFPLMQETWSPPTRVVSGLAGGGLLAWAATHRNPIGALSAVAGAVLLLRSGTNVPLKRMVRGKRSEVTVKKVIEVKAPVARVFEGLAGYGNFPSFMRSARSVAEVEGGKSHWTLAGPGGASYEWDLQTTLNQPNEVLAWRTVGDTAIDHTGIIRFKPMGSDLTRLDIKLTYAASSGARGDVLAELLGSDPQREVEADLSRLKMYVEANATARDRAERSGTTNRTSSSGDGRAGMGQPVA